MRRYGDDYTPPADLGPLFGWPELKPEAAEQKVLPLEPSTEARWLAWKASDDGVRFIESVKVRAYARIANRDHVRVKALIEEVRDRLHISFDNRFQSSLSRLLDRDPMLRGRIEMREKKAV